eukprot:2836293-Prymnesium_polylepis.1
MPKLPLEHACSIAWKAQRTHGRGRRRQAACTPGRRFGRRTHGVPVSVCVCVCVCVGPTRERGRDPFWVVGAACLPESQWKKEARDRSRGVGSTGPGPSTFGRSREGGADGQRAHDAAHLAHRPALIRTTREGAERSGARHTVIRGGWRAAAGKPIEKARKIEVARLDYAAPDRAVDEAGAAKCKRRGGR